MIPVILGMVFWVVMPCSDVVGHSITPYYIIMWPHMPDDQESSSPQKPFCIQ